MSSSSHRLREMIVRKWRGLASGERKNKRSKGHFVVYAKGGKRFVVPLKYLDHPIFRVLLEMAEEEFGNVAGGPLRVPCEEELMVHVVSLLARPRNAKSDVEKAMVSITWACRRDSVLSFCHALRDEFCDALDGARSRV